MRYRILIFSCLIVYQLCVPSISAAAPLHFKSGPEQTIMLELYTSEGCSSCPPAEHWLSTFKHNSQLWRKVVPVAFHVDYWDYLGWKDQFARPNYSARQYQYAAQNQLATVYTPEFFRNGKEWRRGFFFHKLDMQSSKRPGIIQLTLDRTNLTARFTPTLPIREKLLLNLAILGFNITKPIKAGENAGKQLHHDFVVLDFQTYVGNKKEHSIVWQQPIPKKLNSPSAAAIAFWVNKQGDLTPLQSSGGWLQQNKD